MRNNFPTRRITRSYEIATRDKKVGALVAVLRESGIGASAACGAEPHAWIELATTAKVRPPSAATISLVLSILEGNGDMEPECSCRQTDVDLFDARGCELHDSQSQSMPAFPPLDTHFGDYSALGA